jgi:hypothetical protein
MPRRRVKIATFLSSLLLILTLALWTRSIFVEPGSFHIYRPLPPDRPIRTLLLVNWRPTGLGLQTGWLLRAAPDQFPQDLRFGPDEPLWDPYPTAFYRYIDAPARSFHGFHFSWALNQTPASSIRYFYFTVPFWFLTLLFSLLPVRHFRATLRSNRWRRAGCCPTCGYDLRASPEKCPECGAEVPPGARPSTTDAPLNPTLLKTSATSPPPPP